VSEAAGPRFVAGFGRSGTTWVQDVLAQANSMRAVFEPLHPGIDKRARPFANRLIRADEEVPELEAFWRQYFSEPFHSLWADYRVLWPRLYPRFEGTGIATAIREAARYNRSVFGNYAKYRAQRHYDERITKCIRANMMLGWLRQRFDARIVFIIRHPVPVVMSQARVGGKAWDPFALLATYKSDPALVDRLPVPYRRLLSQRHDALEAFTLSWCIENTVALEDAATFGIPVVYYEQLIHAGEPEWRRIVAALGLESMPPDALIARPSQQAWGEKAHDAELVRKYALWMERVDSGIRERVRGILDSAEISIYCVDQALPRA
jgi:hypothetical protein